MNNELLLPTGERLAVDVFRPGDAEGLTRLFRAVYGEGYPVKTVYDPDGLIAAFERKDNVPVVARTVEHGIVGTVSLCRTTPNPELYEAGQGLVLPRYRGSGISSALNRYLMDVVAPGLNVVAVFGESVCNHVYMQKTTAGLGYMETGLEVDLMPREAYTAEKSAEGRVSVLPQFRLYRPEPSAVHVPEMYGEWFRFLYEGLGEERKILPSGDSGEWEGMSNVKSQLFDFARVARVAVFHAGSDFEGVFAAEEEECLFQRMLVIQVWIPLSLPWVGAVARYLVNRGYFFGGLLLRWFGGDGLLMQRVIGRPNWEGITLYTDRAKKIRDIVYGEWERTGR